MTSSRTAPALAFVAVCAPSLALGQAVTLQSGEHESFTRLVFPAPADVSWTVTTADQRHVITFAAPDLSFSLREVWDRIPRARLADVSGDGPTLALDLGCACDVAVTQIASNHVVIDVSDPQPQAIAEAPTPTADPEPKAPAPSRLDLPLRLSPPSDITAGLAAALAPTPVAEVEEATPEAATAIPIEPATTGQIIVRDQTRRGLLPGSLAERSLADAAPTCALEEQAAAILTEDPQAALDTLQALRAEVLDAADTLSSQGVDQLAKAYLTVGWGAEAQQLLRERSGEDPGHLRTIAMALDSHPDIDNEPLEADASCGPATATLLLLSGLTTDSWERVDEEALARFIDRLPDSRRLDLEPRLRLALRRLGQDDVLQRLAPLPNRPQDFTPPSAEILAAGTDPVAIRSTIDFLKADVTGQPPIDDLHVQNALAIRPSIPAGPLRLEFDTALTKRLLLEGYLAEMTTLVSGEPDLAASLLSFAVDELPAERVIEVAARLRPDIRSDEPIVRVVGDLMRQFGLTDAAEEFEAIRGGEGIPTPQTALIPAPVELVPATRLEDPDQAWLARDFARLTDGPADTGAAERRAMAEDIRRRNAAPPVDDDFIQAERALADSRRLSALTQSLLDMDPQSPSNDGLTSDR